MKFYYQKSTGAVFVDAFTLDLPEDTVEITEAEYIERISHSIDDGESYQEGISDN